MPDTGKVLRAASTLALTTLATVPADTKWYIKSVTVANKTNASQAITLLLTDRALLSSLNIPKFGGVRDSDTHVLDAAGTVKVEASTIDLDITIDYVEET